MTGIIYISFYFLDPTFYEHLLHISYKSELITHECHGTEQLLFDDLCLVAEQRTQSGASHGRVITEVRAWLSANEYSDDVSDKCVAYIVRAAIAKRREREDIAEAERQLRKKIETAQRKEEVDSKNWEIWNTLTEAEKGWALYTFRFGDRLDCETLRVGAMGFITIPMEIINVVSNSEAIVDFVCMRRTFQWGQGRLEPSGERKSAWITGLDMATVVDGDRVAIPPTPFWVPRTVSYTTAIGGVRTVYLLEPLQIDRSRVLVIQTADAYFEFLEDYNKKRDSSGAHSLEATDNSDR